MKEFDVTITETLKLTVSVEASSKEEAQQMVSDQWHAGDHILDADNFVEVEFESNDGKEISAERAPDDTLEVLMVKPGQYPRVERIGSDLASLQKAVDGYIEAIYPYDDPVALICGEEAKLEGKPLNRALRDEDGDNLLPVLGSLDFPKAEVWKFVFVKSAFPNPGSLKWAQKWELLAHRSWRIF